MIDITPGFYRHWRGAIYEVICVATEAVTNYEEERKKVVVYKDENGNHYARPVANFVEDVVVSIKTVPRFERINNM